jgi:pimeloyl-ACP methyl ester carboxylesterase
MATINPRGGIARARHAIVAGHRPRFAAALSAFVVLAAPIGVTECDLGSGSSYPVQAAYTRAGPYATTTGEVKNASGKVIYDLYYPGNYAALGFKSPIVTWGNGTDGTPGMVSTLLRHFASYGFTVIASTLANTGSGREIDAAAHYLVAQNAAAGSVFHGKLDVNRVAAVGHSQGAGGAVRTATNDPALIKTVMTFSLPNTFWVGPNPDCPTKADCMFDPGALTRPTFFISTHGPFDAVIASPATQKAFYDSVTVHASLGIIRNSDGKPADHNSVTNTASGGNPGGELGYATAWLEYRLRGNATAAGAFSGAHPELVANTNWPGSATK